MTRSIQQYIIYLFHYVREKLIFYQENRHEKKQDDKIILI